jgi:peptide/nickel transport system substrate-binding protein
VTSYSAVALVSGAPAPVRGGVLRIAQKAEPDTLDITWSTTDLVFWIASHIYETLLAFDQDNRPVPHLASSYRVSSDGLAHTFSLRRGVKFHNGKEMTSSDVVASLKRWQQVSAIGISILGPRTVDIVARDRYTVEWRLRSPASVIPYVLARFGQAAAIYPAEVVQAAGTQMVTQYIGTGPYQLLEWQKGARVRLGRFKDYQPVNKPPNGQAGLHEAYFDELVFIFVPETSVRMLGVERGDFDFANEADRENYPRYRFNLKFKSYLGKAGVSWLAPNHLGPVLSNIKVRQAIQAAVCADEILAVYGHPRFFAKHHAAMGAGPWRNDTGKELYNQCNPDRARRLLQESGYTGNPPIRLLLRSGEPTAGNIGLILQSQLARVGIPLELVLRDAAAFGRIRADRSAYDAIINESNFVPHPLLLSHLPATGLSAWRNEEKERLIDELLVATKDEQAVAIWARIERLWHQDVSTVVFGNFYGYHLARAELQGYVEAPEPVFWNTWMVKR